jgi:hypothetical protein
MRTIVYITSLFLLNCTNLLAQQNTFQRLYHFSNGMIGYALKERTGVGYYVLGSQANISLDKIRIVQLNDSGDTVKLRNFCGFEGSDFAFTPDSGFIITGIASLCIPNVQFDLLVSKVDSSLNQNWLYAFGDSQIDKGKRIINNADGGYTIACYNNSYPDLLKVDSAGNIIWSRSYGLSGLYSVKHNLDGGYFICGNAGSGFVDPMYVAKLDSMGFVIWYKTFYDNGMFIFKDIEPTPDGGVIALCDNWNIYKISATGDSLWKKNVYPAYSRITTTTDGNLIMTGAGMGMALVKTDTSGTIIWGKQFSHYPFNINIGYESNDVIQTSDGGYMLCGLIDSFGVQNLYVVKTDSLGLVTTGLLEVENQLLKSYCYPNPMQLTAHITFSDVSLPELKNNSISLYDSRGVFIKEEEVTSWPYTLQRNNAPPGFYFYTISNEKRVISSGKLVME